MYLYKIFIQIRLYFYIYSTNNHTLSRCSGKRPASLPRALGFESLCPLIFKVLTVPSTRHARWLVIDSMPCLTSCSEAVRTMENPQK